MNTPQLLAIGIKNVRFGEGVKVVEPANLYGCEIGDRCFIGPFVEIQNDVIIGPRTKVQSHAFVCEGVTIGSHCFISHGVMFVNDLFRYGGPAGGDKTKWGRCTIGDHVSIGTGSTVMPVNICSNVVIGAGSVVTKDITEPGIYAGSPAKKMRSLPASAA
jgi:acetyltransferase-like isoleucine patch superfamily enzyme